MVLFDLVTYSTWVSVAIGIIFFRKIDTLALRFFIVFQLLGTIAEFFLIYILPMNDGLYVRIVYCSLKPVEYLLFVYLFNYMKAIKRLKYFYLQGSVVVLFCFAIYNLTINIHSESAATNVILLGGCFTIVLVLLYFRDILKSDKVIYLLNDPLFWIATGLLFFYTGNIIATGFYHRLWAYSQGLAKSLYMLNFILNILLSLLLSIAYIVAYKTKST